RAVVEWSSLRGVNDAMLRTFESVLRADDLLYCQFELVNLALDSSATGAPQLTRAAAGPAFIVVRLPPQTIAEQVVPPGGSEPALPFGAGLAGPSRLTFLVPDDMPAVPFRLDAFLALMGKANLVTANDLASDTTAIECPDRLLLVPPPSSRLVHRTDAVTSQSTGVTELWHTTLSDPATGASPRLQAIANPSDRADRPFATELKKVDRDAIVTLCAQHANIASSLLRLTTLGATAQFKSDWPPVPPTSTLSLTEWEHQTELGRDRYVRTVHQGYLFPFGHRAAITTVTQRQTASHFPLQTAELMQQSFLTILETERSYENLGAYPGKGREMPFVRASIASAPANAVANAPIAVGAPDRPRRQSYRLQRDRFLRHRRQCRGRRSARRLEGQLQGNGPDRAARTAGRIGGQQRGRYQPQHRFHRLRYQTAGGSCRPGGAALPAVHGDRPSPHSGARADGRHVRQRDAGGAAPSHQHRFSRKLSADRIQRCKAGLCEIRSACEPRHSARTGRRRCGAEVSRDRRFVAAYRAGGGRRWVRQRQHAAAGGAGRRCQTARPDRAQGRHRGGDR